MTTVVASEILPIVETLHAAVGKLLDGGRRPKRATMSQLDFAVWWQHLDHLGIKEKSSVRALCIDVHYNSGTVTVWPTPWCPVGVVGVA